MNNYLEWGLVLAGGFATGVFFFGALWVTIKRGLSARIPALWFAISFIVRMAVTLTCFYYLTAGIWQKLVLCLIGFMLARVAVTRFTRFKNIERNPKELA